MRACVAYERCHRVIACLGGFDEFCRGSDGGTDRGKVAEHCGARGYGFEAARVSARAENGVECFDARVREFACEALVAAEHDSVRDPACADSCTGFDIDCGFCGFAAFCPFAYCGCAGIIFNDDGAASCVRQEGCEVGIVPAGHTGCGDNVALGVDGARNCCADDGRLGIVGCSLWS